MKYSEAYDKIIQAYFKDEIKPFHPQFCFCGTLNNGDGNWVDEKVCSAGYKGRELLRMELALFTPLQACGLTIIGSTMDNTNDVEDSFLVHKHPAYEAALFEGMSAALAVLKSIHEKRGEIIDETPAFTKRELQPA